MTLVLQASFDMPENGFKRRGFLRVLRKRFDVGSDTFVGHRFHGSRGSSGDRRPVRGPAANGCGEKTRKVGPAERGILYKNDEKQSFLLNQNKLVYF